MSAILASFEPADAEHLVARLLADYLAPPPTVTVSEWADRYRMLSRKGAAEPGPYRTSRTPYLREPMDMLSPGSPVEEVVLMFAAQVGKSEAGNNFVGHAIDVDPGPLMIVQPTIDMAKRFSRQRITPMIDETPALARRVRANRSRDEANTTLMKDFTGGVLICAGANSAAGLRSMPVKKLFLDEVDAYPLDVDGEGDPVALAEKRTDTFARRRILKTSTPTTAGFSRIEQAFLAGDRRRFQVACVHCAAPQVLKFEHLHWVRDDVGAPIPGTVRYVCPDCGGALHETDKPALLASGRWVADRPTAKIASYHLSGLYSPWLPWESVVADFYDAHQASKAGDVSRLKAWTNTVLAETWEEQGDRVSEHELARRAEPGLARRTVPAAALILTCGVDVQGDRLEARVWAWGPGEESWLIEREIIHGSPGIDATWAALLDQVLTVRWQHATGAALEIAATFIDSGGHHTQEVYNFARVHAWRRVFAVKGLSVAARPILGKPSDVEVNWRGVKLKRGVKLWPLGVDTAKQVLYGRLGLAVPGPGYVHLPAWLPPDEYEQLTAERLVTRFIKGRPRLEWIKSPGRRNEALDCAVYALAAAHWLGVPKWKPLDWDRLRARLAQRSLLEEPAADSAPAPDPPGPPADLVQTSAPASPDPGSPRAPRRVGRVGKPRGFAGRW
jgi:phage terminase large subunit GpA-like protein